MEEQKDTNVSLSWCLQVHSMSYAIKFPDCSHHAAGGWEQSLDTRKKNLAEYKDRLFIGMTVSMEPVGALSNVTDA